jgi:two-component system, OmpR family, phosphate regulon sensor histidine kinase PhoR
MSKRIIYSSILLITAALLCVISLQVSWYNNAHALKTELFERSVQDALRDVVTQIENREAADVITDKLEFYTMPAPVDVPPSPRKKKVSKPGPVPDPPSPVTIPPMPAVAELPEMPPVPTIWVDNPSPLSNTKERIIVNCYEAVYSDSLHKTEPVDHFVLSNATTRYSSLSQIKDSVYTFIDTMTWPTRDFPRGMARLLTSDIHPAVRNRAQVYISVYDNGKYISVQKHKAGTKMTSVQQASSQQPQPPAAIKPQKPVKKKLDEVLNKLVKEIEYKERSQEARLPEDTLARYITQALNNQGIQEPFIFSVKTDTKAKSAIDSANGKQFSIALYPNDIEHKTSMLQIIIPGQDDRIFKSMAMHLMGSFLFTMLIIFAFAYTIYVMMKQKKIAEIRNDFINNMTHEFKTPIATISLAADTISNNQTLSDSERVKHYTSVIKEENRRMNSQVEKVLQLALTDKNTFRLNLATCSLHELVMNALNKFNMIIESDQRKTELHFHAGNDAVVADCFHLENAIANIIDNAIKYSASGSQLTISTKETVDSIRLEIADEGIGMKKEVQKKVFDKFYRAQQGNLHDVKGFGIGLSYVKNIIDAHKGGIGLHSIHGKGTTFVVTLHKKTA